MKEFVKNSFNFKEKLKNILLRIKNSSQNKIFKKKKTLNNSKNEKNNLGLGFIPKIIGFWVWVLGFITTFFGF